MKRIAVLLTVFNRIEKTISCLESLYSARNDENLINFKVFLTNDGSTDGTREILEDIFSDKDLKILQGNGNLYWNGGMNNSWKAALKEGNFDGYLWLNNDSIVYPNLWEELLYTDVYSRDRFKKSGIYVGSTRDSKTGEFSYGGFVFSNKITLNDKFLQPNGKVQQCQAAHGNITFVSHDVVKNRGILFDKYQHSVGDHDYTYLAYKSGFPVLVMREYVGECENDHHSNEFSMVNMSLKERMSYVKSPLGYNLNNSLLFQKRCFPYRFPFVWAISYLRVLFPNIYINIYHFLRKQ